MSRHRHRFSTGDVHRVSAFSDAIFAISLTLPVLELRIPAGSGPVLPQLQAMLPAVFAYVVTFAVGITRYIDHDQLFDAAQAVDEVVLSRNGAFLFLFSLLPFTTALIMSHGSQAIAVILYALNLALLSLTLLWVGAPLLAGGHLREDRVVGLRQNRVRSYAIIGVFTLQAVLALVSPKVALWTPVLLPIVFPVVNLWLGRERQEVR